MGILAGLVAVYIAKFTGDFEARRDGVIVHVEPAADSLPCGEPMGDGDNLTCIKGEDGCATSDEIDGRWVRVERKSEKCWASYGDITYQHGIFMTLVGKVFHLETTDEANAKAIAGYGASLDKRAPALRDKADWAALARIARRIDGKAVTVSETTKAALHEGVSRTRFGELIEQAKSTLAADPARALVILAEANTLKFPAEKPEVPPLRRQAEEGAFAAALVALDDARTDARTAIDRMLALAEQQAPDDKSPLAKPLARIAKRLRADARAKPDDVIIAVDRAKGSEKLIAALGGGRDAITGDLDAAREAAYLAKLLAVAAKASALAAAKPKEAYALVCQARDAPGPADKAAIERVAVRLDASLSATATARARAYLAALGARQWRVVREFDLPFAQPTAPDGAEFAAAKEAWLAAGPALDPKGKRVGKTMASVKECGAKVEVAVEMAGPPPDPPTTVTLAMCLSDKGLFFPCTAPSAAPSQ